MLTTEKALTASNLRWQTTFNGISDSVFLLDIEGKITRTNKSAQKLLNKTEEELLGQKCYEVVHCSEKQIDNCPFVKMKVSLKRETIQLHVDSKWFEIIVDPLFDVSGNLNEAVHFMIDITERKLSEEKLKNYQLLLSACIDSPEDMIVLAIDKQFNYLAYNTYHKNVMQKAYGTKIKPGMNLLECMKGEEDKNRARINYSNGRGEPYYS
jgi:PAS domain S-box-containing protein